MKDVLTGIIKAIVDKPDEVDLTLTESENTKIYELRLGDGDVGKALTAVKVRAIFPTSVNAI